MKHKKGFGAWIAIALMVVALAAVVVFSGVAVAQPTGVGIENQVLAKRGMFYPDSSMYPGIIVDHQSTSDLL
ncbi:MAG TPA: hypothetical protein VM537_35610, partial [Anaerolineae bacterium]|nr:hypothetical protein [Anaerolineae bacterium]